MTDIVERLRDGKTRSEEGPHYLCVEAACEIERLRDALWQIINLHDSEEPVPYSWGLPYFNRACGIARDALADTKNHNAT